MASAVNQDATYLTALRAAALCQITVDRLQVCDDRGAPALAFVEPNGDTTPVPPVGETPDESWVADSGPEARSNQIC